MTDQHYLVTHTVNQDGVRLDAFLKARYRKRSREQIQRAIAEGAITVKRPERPHQPQLGRLKPSYQLLSGDQVLVKSDRKPEPEVSFDYRVLHEDDALFVIDKPANLPVHPSGRYFFNTLLIHLKTRGHREALQAEQMYYLVHRIDKETSGILVLAKEREACAHLTRQFAERRTRKRYLAVARGVTPAEFAVDLAIRRAVGSVIELKMETAPESEGGQPALTEFRRLSVHENRHGAFSLVECFPKTGRQHQIRVHLESAGHPILGDKLYGMPVEEALRYYERKHLSAEAQARLLIPRHALHAAGIEFTHPLTGETREFRSGLPADLQAFLDRGECREFSTSRRDPLHAPVEPREEEAPDPGWAPDLAPPPGA